jgi:DNA-binding PadR family transcriptional regulator
MKNRDCYPVNSGYLTSMDTSVKALEEAISIRRQIDTLESRLSSILGGRALPTTTTTRPAGARYFAPSTRAKLSAAAKARWARQRGSAPTAPAKKKGQLTPAGRRKLSQLMKARWAARRKSAGKKAAPAKKRGTLTPAGRRKLSELMKARWAARRKAAR